MRRSLRAAELDIEEELKLLRVQLSEVLALLVHRHRTAEAVDFAEAGRLLGFSTVSVRRLVSNGTLRAVTIGSRLRIPMSEVRGLAVMGVPERSRWGKRIAQPVRSNAAEEVTKIDALRLGPIVHLPASVHDSGDDAPRPSPSDQAWDQLCILRIEVERLRAALELVTAPAILLSVREAARRLSISSRTLRRLAADGVLRTARLGRRTMVPTSAIDRLLMFTLPPGARRAPGGPDQQAGRAERERARAWRKLKERGLA